MDHPKWTVRGSRHVLKDRWISVRADDCVTATGVSVSPYYVLEYPDFVHALAIDRAGEVVLVNQYRHGLGGVSLELPGGLADAADADPVATAQRELAEETGFAGGTARLIASLAVDPAKLANTLHLVLVEGVERSAAPTPEESERIEVRTVPVAELLDLARAGKIVNAAQVGLILLGLQAAGAIAITPARRA